MKYYDKLIFELSKPGRTGYSLPDSFDAAQQQLPFGNRATLGTVRGGTASEAQRWGRAQRDGHCRGCFHPAPGGLPLERRQSSRVWPRRTGITVKAPNQGLSVMMMYLS